MSAEVHRAVVRALGGFAPTDEQASAIYHPLEPLALIAGAGSGKTAVMAARIAHLITSGQARASEVLGLTFTNKAAQELDERIRRSLAELDLPPGEEVSVFTYHGFADRLVRDFGPKIGVEPEVALLSPAQAYLLIERLFSEVTFERLRVTWLPSLVAKVRSLADACGNHLVTPEQVAAADARLAQAYSEAGIGPPRDLAKVLAERPELCKVVRAYIDRKRELGRIDYGDQIELAHRIVADRGEVAAQLRERWPVVLLDEYQDTNVSQRKMMQAVYPHGSAVTVVGDPDQAIYSWRGATLYNILEFPEHFRRATGAPAEVKTLQRSFRSGRRILAVADAIIGRISPERRGGEKVLEHHPPTGSGDVRADLFASDTEEAEFMARKVAEVAGEGEGRVPYHEIAILCRKRRLFGKIERALRAADIPVEVVGLGGLLVTPEVIDLLAYLRVMSNPGDNIAFARIATGPRWRIDYHDLAALARWAAANTGLFALELSERAEGEEVDPGEERFSLSEALGSLDEIAGLSDEARRRLRRLGDELELMRASVRGATLVDAIERVLAQTGLEDELAASESNVAAAARANLGSFLDYAGDFAPFEGDASIATFLEFLDAAREGGEDLEVAQPQHENSVKLMTVHQAKGLEFDVVFVPGLGKEIFPDVKVTGNPAKAVDELPYAVREDARWLPEFDVGSKMSGFHAALKERVEEDERRLAYVALTRARRRLHATCAHWYGVDYERQTPNGPGDYFVELAGAPASEEFDEIPALDAVSVGRRAECPEDNPLREELARRAAGWPPDDGPEADEVFPEGPRVVVERCLEDPAALEDVIARSGVEPAEFERARAVVAEQLQLVTAPEGPSSDEGLMSLSVSSLVQLARCPKQFYWTVIRPLPRRPSGRARLGQEIHRWIELRSIGQGRLDDPEEPVDVAPEEVVEEAEPKGAPPGPSLEELKRAFEGSRFARLQPRYVEQAFAMTVGGRFLVRGRIDAVYVGDDGTWEVVDYKTGREPEVTDASARLQLTIYALAARRIWDIPPERLRVTYFYLGSGRAEPIPATDLEAGEQHLLALFEQARGQAFEPQPSGLCRGCDFLRFCDAGRAHVRSGPASS